MVFLDPGSLPTINDIINAVDGPKKYLLGKCNLDAKIENNVITVELTAQSCQLDLKQLTDRFYPNNKLAEETQNFLLADMLFMKIEIDKSNKKMKLVAKAPNKIDLIGNKLALADSSVEISLKYENEFSYKGIGVILKGKLLLGKQPVEVSFAKEEESTLFKVTAISKNLSVKLSVKDVVELIGVEEIPAEIFGKDLLKEKILVFEMESIGLEGAFNPATSWLELVVSSEVKKNIAQMKMKCQVMISKMSGEPTKVGVIAKLESIKLEDLIKDVVGKETEIASIFQQKVDAILLVASGEINAVQNDNLKSLVKSISVENKDVIPIGITLKFELNVEKVKSCLYMRYNTESKKFEFKLMPKLNIKLIEAMKKFSAKPADVQIPKWLDEPKVGIELNKFSFGLDGSFELDISVSGELRVASTIRLDKVNMVVSRDSVGWQFSLNAEMQVSKETDLMLSIRKVKDSYELEGNMTDICVKDLLKYLGQEKNLWTNQLKRFNLQLQNLRLKATLSKDGHMLLRYVDCICTLFSLASVIVFFICKNLRTFRHSANDSHCKYLCKTSRNKFPYGESCLKVFLQGISWCVIG